MTRGLSQWFGSDRSVHSAKLWGDCSRRIATAIANGSRDCRGTAAGVVDPAGVLGVEWVWLAADTGRDPATATAPVFAGRPRLNPVHYYWLGCEDRHWREVAGLAVGPLPIVAG